MFRLERAHLVTKLDTVTWRVCIVVLSLTGAMLLVLPTLIVLATSLNEGYVLRFPPSGLSLRWYVELFREASSDLQEAAITSFKISSLATMIGLLIATPAALALSRTRISWARGVETAFLSPLMIPGIAMGLGILVWLNQLNIRLSFATLVAGHVIICSPYIFRTACIGFGQLDVTLLEVSRTLGAGRFRTFRKVALPLALPSLLAGAFLGFTYSFDNVAISIFLSDARTEVLPIRLWSLMEDQLDVRVASIAGLLILLTFVMLAVMERLFRITRYVR
jgi:putative spermidine/putrescine transport system permease protein